MHDHNGQPKLHHGALHMEPCHAQVPCGVCHAQVKRVLTRPLGRPAVPLRKVAFEQPGAGYNIVPPPDLQDTKACLLFCLSQVKHAPALRCTYDDGSHTVSNQMHCRGCLVSVEK